MTTVVGNADKFFEDFQQIVDHLLQDLKLGDVQKKDALEWIGAVCPSGLATLWDACLKKMLTESKQKGYEKQEEIKQEVVDKLKGYIYNNTRVGEAARKFVLAISKKSNKRRALKRSIDQMEEELEDLSGEEKKEMKQEIKEKKEAIADIEGEIKDLEEQLQESSSSFHFATQAFENVLDRLFRVTVEVEVQ